MNPVTNEMKGDGTIESELDEFIHGKGIGSRDKGLTRFEPNTTTV